MMLRTVIFSKLFWACALIVAVALGAAWFVYGGDIAAKYDSTRFSVVEALGLGIVPVAMWIAAVLGLAVWKREWLRPVNIWIGSIAYVAAVFGVLSYFHPEEGPLAAFVPTFNASLGGNVGDAIAGETAWLGGVRTFALVAVGTAIAGPRFSLDALKLLGRASVMVYVAFMMAGGGVLSLFRGLYKSDDKSEVDTPADRHSESEALRKALEAQQANAPATSLRYGASDSTAAGAAPTDLPTLRSRGRRAGRHHSRASVDADVLGRRRARGRPRARHGRSERGRRGIRGGSRPGTRHGAGEWGRRGAPGSRL